MLCQNRTDGVRMRHRPNPSQAVPLRSIVPPGDCRCSVVPRCDGILLSIWLAARHGAKCGAANDRPS